MNQLFIDEVVIDDSREEFCGDEELIFRVADVKSKFAVHEGDHGGKEFFFFSLGGVFELPHVFDGLLDGDLFFVDLDELSFG